MNPYKISQVLFGRSFDSLGNRDKSKCLLRSIWLKENRITKQEIYAEGLYMTMLRDGFKYPLRGISPSDTICHLVYDRASQAANKSIQLEETV